MFSHPSAAQMRVVFTGNVALNGRFAFVIIATQAGEQHELTRVVRACLSQVGFAHLPGAAFGAFGTL